MGSGFVFHYAGTSRLMIFGGVACQGVVVNQVQASVRLPGFAFSFAVAPPYRALPVRTVLARA